VQERQAAEDPAVDAAGARSVLVDDVQRLKRSPPGACPPGELVTVELLLCGESQPHGTDLDAPGHGQADLVGERSVGADGVGEVAPHRFVEGGERGGWEAPR
jgi:hypothetical protein